MLYKIINLKNSFLMIILLMSNSLLAHQPDLSNIVISKTDNGQVILQINSSLTAFQQEVNFINGEGFYKSPEEFRNLVIKHFNNSFSIIINKKDTLQFKNPKVFLGHETKFVTEIIGLPKTINSIQLKNELFKDIYHSQSIVIFLLDQFPKKKYSLNNDNQHQINIAIKDGNWVNNLEKSSDFDFKCIGYLAILFVFATLLVLFLKKLKKNKL